MVLLGLWVAGTGCSGGGGEVAPAPGSGRRVDAVLVDPKAEATAPDAFCESWHEAEDAPRMVLPDLAEGAWAPATGWRWVNVWATWCGPCVAEMPRLVTWRDKLARESVDVDLVFLSVDAGQPEVDRFYAKQKGFPPTVRIADLEAMPDWLKAVGLDAGAPIPIHLFVDPEDRLRCVRTGAISESDYGAVKRVLGG